MGGWVSRCLYVKMPITRGYETILKDLDEYKERLSDDWQRVQFKRHRAKKESAKTFFKGRMNLIARTIVKLQNMRGILVRVHENHGNSLERQKAKEEVESRMFDLEKLMVYFSQY